MTTPYCTITEVFLCGLSRTRRIPYVGPQTEPVGARSTSLPYWGQTTYTDRKGYRCQSCIDVDRLDHPIA